MHLVILYLGRHPIKCLGARSIYIVYKAESGNNVNAEFNMKVLAGKKQRRGGNDLIYIKNKSNIYAQVHEHTQEKT